MNSGKIKCNLCDSEAHELIYERTPRTRGDGVYTISETNIQKPDKIYKCKGCGLIFAGQDMDLKYYAEKYSEMIDDGYMREERGRRQSGIAIIKRVEMHKKGGKLLDIGCANGFLLDEARQRGWDTYGVEISRWAVAYARENLNLNVKRSSLRKAGFTDKSFDVVIMLDVLEHLTHPRRTLLEVSRVLKDDGILYISTPNIASAMSRLLKAKWWGINQFHLFYFSTGTLKKMLDSCDMKIKTHHPHIRIFSVNYWVRRFSVYSRTIYRMLNFISRIGRWGDALLKINLRDQIETVAIKKM